MTLWQSSGDHVHDELVLLAPEGVSIPESFSRRCVGRGEYARRLIEAQKVRGRIYLMDGAVRADQLTADGRHVQRADYDSWHVLAVDENGDVQGCARYRHLTGYVGFDDLGVRDSWLARCAQWGLSLRAAVESEIVLARQRGMAFAEAGGWAVAPQKRNTTEALRIAMATYGLARILGGCVGITTATQRHRSSSILRRIGGCSLECGGTKLPSYYDPQYRCQMEILRFDSSLPDASCRSWVEQLSERLTEVPVLVAREPAESHFAPAMRPMPAAWPAQPRLRWATEAGL